MKNNRTWFRFFALALPLFLGVAIAQARPAFYLWLEAESLLIDGKELPATGFGHWDPAYLAKVRGFRIAGPGVLSEWSQGGESEWSSLATPAAETDATVSAEIELPAAGAYRVWIRYFDYQAKTELFKVEFRKDNAALISHTFGNEPVIYERDEFKQYWGKAFAWDKAEAALPAGRMTLRLLIDEPAEAPRHIDCLLITDDMGFEPDGRRKPDFEYMKYLDAVRRGGLPEKGLVEDTGRYAVGKSWSRPVLAGRDFVMAYNMPVDKSGFWGQDPTLPEAERVLYPYSVTPKLAKRFQEQYAGRKDVPIFSSPLIAPVIYIIYLGKHLVPGARFHSWLVETERPFVILTNYGTPSWDATAANAVYDALTNTLGAQWLGFISGESLPYFPPQVVPVARMRALKPKNDADEQLLAWWRSRLDIAKECGGLWRGRTKLRLADRPAHAQRTGEVVKKCLELGSRSNLGKPIENMMAKSISCLSSSHMTYSHLLREWGATNVGSEHSAVMTNSGMRLAFQRGAARQYGGCWTFYHAPNFGDSSTTFGAEGKPTYYYWHVSRYGPGEGPSITWYRKSLLHQFMSGLSMLYYEQGGDQFFQPKPGKHPVMLNPIGKVTDEFLTFAEKHPGRGTTYTPIAFLLDINHGWGLNRYHAGYMDGAFRETESDRAIRALFDVAYYPHPEVEGEPCTADRQAFVSSVFGEMFDVLVTSPTRREAIHDYSVLIVSGDVAWSKGWTRELEEFARAGGTLVLNAAQVGKPWKSEFLGVALSEKLRTCADGAVTTSAGDRLDGVMFRYAPGKPRKGTDVLAATSNGDPIVTRSRVGDGQVIVLSIPHGLGLDRRPHPVLAWLMTNLSAGLLPIVVEGNVQYLINKNAPGWVVTLINNEGLYKPQLGLARIERGESVPVTLKTKLPVAQSTEWTSGRKVVWRKDGRWNVTQLTVPVCGIEIIALQ